MSKHKLSFVASLILLAAATCLCAAGAICYRSQFAFVGETRYEKSIESIDLSGSPAENLETLQNFPGLKQIDLRGTGLTCEQYEDLKEQFPKAQIFWDIPFQGQFLDMHTETLTLTALSDRDMATLSYFNDLKTIFAEDCPDYENLHTLRQQRPDLEISYRIPVGGSLYSYDVTDLTLPGADAAELCHALSFLTDLKTVELTQPLAPADQLATLVETFPEVQFSWNLELAGIPVNERTETLNLAGTPLTVEQMDAVLPYLWSLIYVDMSDCGISNEEMDALNRRYEDIKIVWTVDMGRFMRLRTDATWFMPGKWNYIVDNQDVYNLRYCTDMICVDLGHMPVDNCEWVRNMPHLKYLLLADTKITDISPIAGLQELVFLEIFLTDVTDYSPMLECPALEDINLHYTYGDPNIVKQLTWVNNIWWRNIRLSDEDRQMLREALPNTYFEFFSKGSTDKGWRKLQNYYDHRDLMGMYYMD